MNIPVDQLRKAKYSIIIPTYNHLNDCLIPCLESIQKYTDLDNNIEIIIVANGCTDGTIEWWRKYSWEMQGQFHSMLVFDEGLGYTKAINEGLKEATGDFIILLNNDTLLLEQETNKWIEMLVEPMKDQSVGITGPLVLHDDYADHETIIFFCAMLRKTMVDQLGLLDEIYSPGGGEDIDYSVRATKAGWKMVQVPGPLVGHNGKDNIGGFPIWHKDNQTFKDIHEYGNGIVQRNGLINCIRYNQHIKLNLGSGGQHIPGFLSVDSKDKRAHVWMDATKLEFPDNSIEVIIASHLFEHINPYKAMDTLRHWYDKLKSGGWLIMEMPDIEQLCKAFITANKQERYGFLNCIYGAVNTTAEGSNSDITAPHLWGWYPEILIDHVAYAGFININCPMPEQYPHPGFNFRLEARKP